MNPAALFHLVWPYVLQLGGVVFAAFVAKKVHNTADSARAQQLAAVAKDVAAAIYANNPTLPWVDLMKQVVDTLAGTATPNITDNRSVLERAAAGALAAVGALPKK